MASNTTYNFQTYTFGGADLKSGVQREDLLEQITNIDPWDTPWVSQAPKVTARHVYHQWMTDTLATLGGRGALEGADWGISPTADPTTAPARTFNVTEIFRKDIGVSETERAVDTVGFKDHYAYEVQKATKELAIKLEKAIFAKDVNTSGSSASARAMKGLQGFIATNSAFAGAFGTSTETIYKAGGSPEQVYVSPRVKRIVSAFVVPGASTTQPMQRTITAIEKKLVSSVDFYDSDFGLIQIVLDRWVPESGNNDTATANINASDAATTATADAGAVAGQAFFLSRAINRLAWLRPMSHQLVGKRGDNVAGYIVGECTLEVLNEKANGRIRSINNASNASI
jgi:hypothetical protein